MTYIHVAEGCYIESKMHRGGGEGGAMHRGGGGLICAIFVRIWHKQVFS